MMNDILEKAKTIAGGYICKNITFDEKSIRIGSEDAEGFSFSLVCDSTGWIIHFGNWHYPFEEEDEALWVFEHCLSGNARLKEVTSFGNPCKGFLGIFDGDSPNPVYGYETGIMTPLNFFLFPKKKMIYCNHFKRVESLDKS